MTNVETTRDHVIAKLILILRASLVGVVLALPCASASAQLGRQRPPPRYAQFAPGLLARTRFSTDSGSRHVEIWDLLVGPAVRSKAATLPGGAVLEIRAGSGRILIDGTERELRQGQTFAVAEGASFAFVNSRRDLGLAIRAVIISARRR